MCIKYKRIICGCIVVALLCVARIWYVNHLDIVNQYRTKRQIYPAGEEVALQDAMYHIDVADLKGYYVKVTDVKVVQTADFLKQYGMDIKDLEKMTDSESGAYDTFGLLCLVTAEFHNEQWDSGEEQYVLLDNFLLVGDDYWINPATDTINQIAGVNPELDGASSFCIQSERTFEVTIPYLIPSKGEKALSVTNLKKSEPKLLLMAYPEETFLQLPEITNVEKDSTKG